MTKLQHDRNIMGDKPEVADVEADQDDQEVEAPRPKIETAADLQGSKRLPDETFENYKIRRRRENTWTKARLKHGAGIKVR